VEVSRFEIEFRAAKLIVPLYFLSNPALHSSISEIAT
jgi:hypothetical protein